MGLNPVTGFDLNSSNVSYAKSFNFRCIIRNYVSNSFVGMLRENYIMRGRGKGSPDVSLSVHSNFGGPSREPLTQMTKEH